MAEVTDTSWRGVAAWRCADDHLELMVSVFGGHLAAIRVPGEELNPLWQPGWEPCDPTALDAAAIERLGGDEAAARLLASIVGHNPCIDRFGPPRPGEGRPFHGEAPCVAWSRVEGAADLAIRAVLPEAGLTVERHFTLRGDGSALMETVVAHADDAPRAIEWCEHVSLGSPFIDGATIAAGVDGAWNFPGGAFEPGTRFAGPGEEPLDPTAVLAMPAEDAEPCGDVATCGLAKGWFEVVNRGHRLRYEWDEAEFPWLAVWTQHRSRREAPWHGRERAKGLEFSTKPFPEVTPPERAETFQGRPTTCRVPPGDGLRREVTITWRKG